MGRLEMKEIYLIFYHHFIAKKIDGANLKILTDLI